jgi:hypothetical protein
MVHQVCPGGLYLSGRNMSSKTAQLASTILVDFGKTYSKE